MRGGDEPGLGDYEECAVAFDVNGGALGLVEYRSGSGLEFTWLENCHGLILSHFWAATNQKPVLLQELC